jgi:hypothetical protein
MLPRVVKNLNETFGIAERETAEFPLDNPIVSAVYFNRNVISLFGTVRFPKSSTDCKNSTIKNADVKISGPKNGVYCESIIYTVTFLSH